MVYCYNYYSLKIRTISKTEVGFAEQKLSRRFTKAKKKKKAGTLLL